MEEKEAAVGPGLKRESGCTADVCLFVAETITVPQEDHVVAISATQAATGSHSCV